MKTILDVRNVKKYYTTKKSMVKAVDDLSFLVKEGDFVGIMGASGSGKSTLLNCVATIDSVTSGKIYVNGHDITKLKGRELANFRSSQLGFIFQEFNLLDTLTAYENITLPLSIQNIEPGKIELAAKNIARELGISEELSKYPYELSGGQQQRVASARAMVNHPAIILADEPTGALDSKSAKMLLNQLKILNSEMLATILMVTHDYYSASYCKRILFIKDGKVYKELINDTSSRKMFFEKILEVIATLGGKDSFDD